MLRVFSLMNQCTLGFTFHHLKIKRVIVINVISPGTHSLQYELETRNEYTVKRVHGRMSLCILFHPASNFV
jgi:hypothetical protein